ncbi:hypothetical protein Bhyg_08966 [Pseudolycoriella hygida]|uniref:Uncharacterized protein n=1 Tax=Pseudolycoriella hygida TaxID=35572 RepID=A0A9Q0N6W8_9DIPT|nr:hypothetical protein Bhyg_08966 [Pseudolycoriella hygida]
MPKKPIKSMQQLLSYQTARRIYGERSYKKYVSKRTCISLTFSIGFFMLILGFLLGKFVSQRQQKLKQLYEPEVIQLIRSILQAKQTAQNMWHTSITHFSNDSLHNSLNDSMLAFNQTNSKLLAKMKFCGQPLSHELLIDSEDFIIQLLNEEMMKLLYCFKEVNELLNPI